MEDAPVRGCRNPVRDSGTPESARVKRAKSMSNNASAKSIAEVIAEAEKQKAETARRVAKEYAQRRQAEAKAVADGVAEARRIISGAGGGKASGSAPAGGARAASPAPGPAKKADGLRDEFDYALEAVETARKTLGRDPAAVEKMATNLLMARAGVSRADAPRFIRKAVQYLDG